MRSRSMVIQVFSPSDYQGADQGGDSGVNMNHGSSGKIQCPQVPKPSADSPDPMADRIIHKCRPEQGKDQKSGKLHPLGKSPDNQSLRDYGKHGLENHKGLM